MSKSPQYPIAAVDEAAPDERRPIDTAPPPGLYAYPSFKHRHEVRTPAGSGDAAYYRVYPQFAPRRMSPRMARRQAIRHGD